MRSPAQWRDFSFMRRFKLTVEYDGTDFAGWQYQSNARTVQGELEKTLSQLLQEEVRITGAGRTDTGVHARGQVAHCETENPMNVRSINSGINALLPADIVVRSTEEVEKHFHARHSALWRKYRYTISQEPIAIGRTYAWHWGQHLDDELLKLCAAEILGEHDFQAFSKVDTNVEHFRCQVRRAEWNRKTSMVTFDIESNRFLYGMVRALVGTMVEIGRGHRPLKDFRRILDSKDRSQAGMAAPAAGLVLEKVIYTEEKENDA